MEELNEKIYKVLETKKHSISISEIVKEIQEASKLEITKKLSEMKRNGIVYRKIKEGKAYYSIDPLDGEGRNALQEQINNSIWRFSRVFSTFENKQVNDMEVFNKSDESQEINANSNVSEDVNKFEIGFVGFDTKNLEYKKNICFENDTYKMGIPDSFEYLPGENNRDFVAYLPKENLSETLSYEMGGANIIIYSSSIIPNSNDKKRILETKSILYDVFFWNSGYISFELLCGKPEYKVVDLKCGRTGVVYMNLDTSHIFYFMCCLKKAFKQIRIDIQEVNGTKEDIEKIAIALMNKFEVKEQVNDFYELDDKKYLSDHINKDLVNDWICNIEGIQNSLKEYYQILSKLSSLKVNVMTSKNTFNLVKFKSEIRDELKRCVLIKERYIKSGENFINHLKSIEAPNDLTIPIYYCFRQFLEQKEFSVDFDDGSTITQKVTFADEVEKRIFNNEIMKLISEYSNYDKNPEVVKKRKQKEKIQKLKEKEEGFLFEISRDLKKEQQTYEHETKEVQEELKFEKKKIEEEYNSLKNEQLDKLKKEKDDNINDLKKNIELLKKENKIKGDEISTLGVLKFIQKNKLKIEININNQNIKRYSEQITKANVDYKKERDELIKSIDNEYNKKMANLEHTFKMPINPKDIIEKLSNISSKPSQTFVKNDRNAFQNVILRENDKIMQTIYKTLIELDKPATSHDLMNANMELSRLPNQKIYALLLRMVNKRYVVRLEYKKTSYFRIGDVSYTPLFNSVDYSTINSNSKRELIDKDRNNSYSKTRTEIYELLKNIKTINPIKKDEITKIKDLTMLRIYQILFSLEEDGLISKSINDNTIIFNVK